MEKSRFFRDKHGQRFNCKLTTGLSLRRAFGGILNSMSRQTSWRCYEEVAQHLLRQIAAHFELGSVEGKQIIAGASGTGWEIDAKGLRRNDEGFVIVECRRYTTRGVPQKEIGALIFSIQDTGAVGGIIVSPLPLQLGAKIVAESQGIQHIQLSADSTTTDYVLRFLEHTFHGVPFEARAEGHAHIDATVIRASEAPRC
jgi:hypothetical protein